MITHIKGRQENQQGKEVRMEQLIERRRKQVQRMSTTRIWQQLINTGYDKVGLESLSRQELMNILAEDLLLESLTIWWKTLLAETNSNTGNAY